MNPIEPSSDLAEVDRRLTESVERYRSDPYFHARVRMVAQLFELRKAPEMEVFSDGVRHEIMLGMALQAVVATEVLDGGSSRLCGQQHPMIDGGAPCIARGSHVTHTTASGKSWQSR